MSEYALTLLYWVSNARSHVADNETDSAYCMECARRWANKIFWG